MNAANNVRTSEPSRSQLEAWDRTHVWHPFTQMAEYEPLFIERAEGCTLFDIDGRAYLDGTSSLWCNVHGYRHPKLDAALVEQLAKVAHTTSLGASNSTTTRLARRLTEIAPAGLNRVYFSDDGATSVEAALKMAFQYWRQRPNPRPEKTCYVAFDQAYHGDTLGSVSVGGVQRFHAMFAPLLFRVLRLPSPGGAHPHQTVDGDLARMESLLAERHAEIAAVVIEPMVQAAAGMVMHAPEYLRGLREITRRHEVLLIADEVAVGFGRSGRMFACEHAGISPDFLCVAKGLTGGYLPLAATLTTDEVFAAFLGRASDQRQFFHGHTYSGNPLGAAVALASLDVFAEDRVLDQLPPKIERLANRLAQLAQHPHVGRISHLGLMAGIELLRDRQNSEAYPSEERRGWRACSEARRQGALVRPLGDVVVVMPPLAMTVEEIDRLMNAVAAGIDAATV